MLVLHIVPDERDRLCLWAEDSTLPLQHTEELEQSPGVPNSRNHPFAVDTPTLENILAEFDVVPVRESKRINLELLLPSSQFGPQPSPHLQDDVVSDISVECISPWTIPALRFDPRMAETVLEALAAVGAEATTDNPVQYWGTDIILGDTVQYWQTVSSLAYEFVNSGRVVPHLGREDGRVFSIWRAFPSTSEDADRIEILVESMPPLVQGVVTDDTADRASQNEDRESISNSSASDVLTQTLDRFVDAIVRDRLASTEIETSTGGLNNVQKEWINGLTGEDKTIDAERNELETLYTQLDIWAGSPEAIDEQSVRLCFQLREPNTTIGNTGEEDPANSVLSPDGWELELLLQSVEEPSLVVEASTIWESDKTTSEVLVRHLDRPKEILLEELSRATSIYSALETLLTESRPTKLELTNGEAAEFLQETVEELQEAGFGVILPRWWSEPERRLGARLTAGNDEPESPNSIGPGLGVNQLCNFRWDIVLDNQRLSKDELEKLSSLKKSLVYFRGKWVSVREGDVENALELYEQRGEEMALADVLQADTELSDTDPGLPVVDKQLEGSLETLFDTNLQEWIDEADTPGGFNGELRPYQKRGLGWIRYLEELGFGGCLADDMGLGKTIQVLARLVDERSTDPLVGPTLVVCPLSVVFNWKDEANTFTPEISVHIHHGPRRKSGDELTTAIERNDLIISTYGTVRSDIEKLEGLQFHRVVLDEAQNIKNATASRTQAIQTLSTYHRLALTGTPIENRLSELWSIMQFCNPGLLGSESEFRSTFSRPIEEYNDKRKVEQLRRLIRPFILRRSKTDETIIDDLPEKTEKKEYCPLTEEQATLYKAATDRILAEIEQVDSSEKSNQILKLINALKSICNHPRQYLKDDGRISDRSGKLNKLEDLVSQIAENGEQALIFTQYTSMAELIQQHLQQQLGHQVLYLHGGTSKQQRDEMIEEFESTDGPLFFLLSLHAGGTGMNLTPASHVIHYDRWWNPAVEDQATDRAYRIGQQDNVQVYKLICKGTIEEAIDQIIEEKKELADQVLIEGDEWMKDLSDDELRDLVSLSEEMLV